MSKAPSGSQPLPVTKGPPVVPVIQGPPTVPVIQGPPKVPVTQGPPKVPVTQEPPKAPVTQEPPKAPVTQGPPKGPVIQGPLAPPVIQEPPALPVIHGAPAIRAVPLASVVKAIEHAMTATGAFFAEYVKAVGFDADEQSLTDILTVELARAMYSTENKPYFPVDQETKPFGVKLVMAEWNSDETDQPKERFIRQNTIQQIQKIENDPNIPFYMFHCTKKLEPYTGFDFAWHFKANQTTGASVVHSDPETGEIIGEQFIGETLSYTVYLQAKTIKDVDIPKTRVNKKKGALVSLPRISGRAANFMYDNSGGKQIEALQVLIKESELGDPMSVAHGRKIVSGGYILYDTQARFVHFDQYHEVLSQINPKALQTDSRIDLKLTELLLPKIGSLRFNLQSNDAEKHETAQAGGLRLFVPWTKYADSFSLDEDATDSEEEPTLTVKGEIDVSDAMDTEDTQ